MHTFYEQFLGNLAMKGYGVLLLFDDSLKVDSCVYVRCEATIVGVAFTSALHI